jgi:hypothetical protein
MVLPHFGIKALSILGSHLNELPAQTVSASLTYPGINPA